MVEEFTTIEQLERIKRLVDNNMGDLASVTIDAMIEQRKQRIQEFETELEKMFEKTQV